MLTDPWFYAVAIPAVIITGLSKSGFVSGIGLMATPLLALVVSPVQAAGIMLPILVASDVIGVWAYRRSFDWANLMALLPGAVVGVLIGWLTASKVSDAHVRLLVGLIALAFTIDYWLRPKKPDAGQPAVWTRGGTRAVAGTIAGLFAGFTSFVSHAGGPPVQMFLLPQRLSSTLYAGTTVMFFGAINLIKVPPYLALGQFHAANLRTSLVLLPVAAVSTLTGIWIVNRVSAEPFYRLAYAALFVVALKLTWDGASAIWH